jgi:hypothetical protein
LVGHLASMSDQRSVRLWVLLLDMWSAESMDGCLVLSLAHNLEILRVQNSC